MALNENIKSRRIQLKMSLEYVQTNWASAGRQLRNGNRAKAVLHPQTWPNWLPYLKWMYLSWSILRNGLKIRKRQRLSKKLHKGNAKMHVGRVFSYLTINAGWDGYSSGLYSPMPLYWLAILAVGLILLFLTSIDMNKKWKFKKLQIAIGLVTILSIFIMPELIPVKSTGVRYLLSDVVTAVCLIVLNLKYWRHIWGNSRN